MAICKKCKEKHPDTAQKCRKCGAALPFIGEIRYTERGRFYMTREFIDAWNADAMKEP